MSCKGWYRFWCAWIVTAIIGDTIAYVIYGKDTTLSVFIRRSFLVQPVGRWSRIGQILITSFLAWLAAHLCFDVFNPLPASFDAMWRSDGTRIGRARPDGGIELSFREVRELQRADRVRRESAKT
jgi:hypothetical protein